MKRLVVGMLAAGLLAAACRVAPADVFLLTNGGRVEGEWINRDEPHRKTYVIGLPSGGQITFQNAQVKQVVEARPTSWNMKKSARNIRTRPRPMEAGPMVPGASAFCAAKEGPAGRHRVGPQSRRRPACLGLRAHQGRVGQWKRRRWPPRATSATRAVGRRARDRVAREQT